MKTNLLNTIKVLGLAVFFMAGMTSISSCSKKGCTDPTSDNFDPDADKDDDSCNDPRTKFVGNYNVTEPGSVSYTMGITSSSVQNRTIILNSDWGFGVPAFNLNATVSQSQMTIAAQTAAGATFQGTGSINGNILTINYSVTAGGSTENYTATATKQ